MSMLESTAVLSHHEFLVMSDDERAAYETWREQRAPYRDGSAQQRAFIAGMRSKGGWHDLDAAGQEHHRQTCPDLCAICADHRAFGECSRCGGDTEAIGADELSLCCGSRVILTPSDSWSPR